MTQIHFTKPLLILAFLLILTGAVLANAYQPQDFAAMREQDALHAETERHKNALNLLDEQARANAYANTAARRQYWTLALSGLALALLAGFVVSGAGYSSLAVVYTLSRGLPLLAEGRKRYKEVLNRPDFYKLPDGRTVFETRRGVLMLLDQTGAAIPLTGQAVPANPELVQVILAEVAARVAIEQAQTQGKIEVING